MNPHRAVTLVRKTDLKQKGDQIISAFLSKKMLSKDVLNMFEPDMQDIALKCRANAILNNLTAAKGFF